MSKDFKVTTKIPPIDELDSGDESLLNLFDQDNPDIMLFNLVDDEMIKLSGSKLRYYKYYQSSDYDASYMEARNKVLDKEGLDVFGHYDPTPVEENLTEFGMELTNDQIFIFNIGYIERKLGRRPIPGDVIKPYFQEQKYKIFEVQEDAFEGYGVYHLNCYAKLLRDHPDIQDVINTDENPDVGGYSGLEDKY